MFRKLLGFGLLILLVTSLFSGLRGRQSRSAYYEGYEAGLQAQSGAEVGSETAEGSETAAETSAPAAAPHQDGFGYGRSFGWGALGILGIFAIFAKIGFFFLLLMIIFRLLRPHRWQHHGSWHRSSWGCHKHGHGPHEHHPFKEKSPKWMDDSDDDEPVMTV
jgi:hypothetical protein